MYCSMLLQYTHDIYRVQEMRYTLIYYEYSGQHNLQTWYWNWLEYILKFFGWMQSFKNIHNTHIRY